jgi:hypothetical protein
MSQTDWVSEKVEFKNKWTRGVYFKVLYIAVLMAATIWLGRQVPLSASGDIPQENWLRETGKVSKFPMSLALYRNF